jgi:secondary thiamine-phosphate synthase enzyme
LESFTVSTRERTEMIEITGRVQAAVGKSGVREGLVVVYVPHTTAAVTINENADPDVQRDILKELNKIVPFEDGYSHQEGNSAAHVKAALIGPSVTVPVSEGSLVLGTWQAVYFCEFDGPRTRRVVVSIS